MSLDWPKLVLKRSKEKSVEEQTAGRPVIVCQYNFMITETTTIHKANYSIPIKEFCTKLGIHFDNRFTFMVSMSYDDNELFVNVNSELISKNATPPEKQA